MSNPQRGERGTWKHLAWWEYGQMDLARTQAHLYALDADAALFIAAERMGELHYAVTSERWHIWDGRCHRPDDSGEVGRIVIDLGLRLRQMLQAARAWVMDDVDKRHKAEDLTADAMRKKFEQAWEPWKACDKYGAGLLRNAGANALAGYLAKWLGISEDDLADRHPQELNTESGTVWLPGRLVKPHDTADRITYCVPARYRPELTWACPQFLDLVHRMAGRNGAVADYVMRVLGYALLGENPEQLIFFLNGPTSSGKSQVLSVVRQVLGPALAEESKADLITHQPRGRNARVENSIRGRRLITISELSERMHIDDGQVKG